eukprot:scaffold641217_cov59-Attheya_sp.AAC.2
MDGIPVVPLVSCVGRPTTVVVVMERSGGTSHVLCTDDPPIVSSCRSRGRGCLFDGHHDPTCRLSHHTVLFTRYLRSYRRPVIAR